jgi:hypothetical protein
MNESMLDDFPPTGISLVYASYTPDHKTGFKKDCNYQNSKEDSTSPAWRNDGVVGIRWQKEVNGL